MGTVLRLGQLLSTPGALALGVDLLAYVRRHQRGDWGDLVPEDRAANERALREGTRVFSAYQLGDKGRLWIITEADRSATTCLLPEEY